VPTVFFMLYLWLILLVAIWLCCVIKIPSEERCGLLPAGLSVILFALILFGGEWLLKSQDLTWRNWPKIILCVLTWVSGLTAGVLTVRDVPRVFKQKGAAIRGIARAFAVFCLFMTMWFGTIMGGLWAMGPSEKVGTWQGRKVVQGKWVWMDTSYELYEDHGPLVRGNKGLAWGEGPFF